LETLPNTTLCLIGIAGVIAAFFTLKVIKKQTETTQRSVLLQETAMQQWVIIQNWTTQYSKWLPKDGIRNLDVNFDTVNPTPWPLTILIIKMRIEKAEKAFLESRNIFLAPKEAYTSKFINVPLDEDQQKKYSNAGIELVVFGCVSYEGFGAKPRIFSGVLHCSTTGATFEMKDLSGNPYREKE
jgi:hypothetical protein